MIDALALTIGRAVVAGVCAVAIILLAYVAVLCVAKAIWWISSLVLMVWRRWL